MDIQNLKPKSLIAMDLDGTLCEGECWDDDKIMHALPIQKMIELNNKLYCSGHHIIIYTARPEKQRLATEYWLKKNGVRFHALRMDKMGASCYIDDKSINPKNIC